MQNTSPIFSAPAKEVDTPTFVRVKLGADGGEVAGALDQAVGTTISGYNDPGGDTSLAIQDLTFGIHFATIGNGTDVAIGDELEALAGGKLVKRVAGPAVAIALEACTADGDQIRVKYLPQGNSFRIVAAGIHTWAGGVATTDSIAVTGLLATDIVLTSLVLRSATQTLVSSVNDEGNDQIDLTLSANGANGGEKIAYAVIRA